MSILKKVQSVAYKGLKTAVKAPGKVFNKVMDNYEGKLKKMDHAQLKRNIGIIDKEFPGGVPEYMKMVQNNPLPTQKPRKLLK